ncbi:MAG: DNA translocase FtsK [Anaerolineae bacterium]|nr:DNA translocase FtsK [Anaerolineae bacterium]
MNTILPAQFMTANTPLQPITNQEHTLITGLAEQCQKVLGEHGLGRVMMDGGILPPRFETMGLSGDGRVGVIKLDVSPASLPGKGSVAKATSKPVLSDLSGRTGYPWIGVNHTGVTYVIWLEQTKHQPMPNTVTLNWTARPKDESYPIALGVDQMGHHRWMSLHDTVHILVGGESRSGKSTWAHATLAGLLPFYSPDELHLALLDAKGVEFLMWRDIPHLVAPIADEPPQADALLASIAVEMDRRKTLFTEVMARNLEGYNQAAKMVGRPTLPLFLVVMDELTDFIVQRPDLGKSFTRSLTRLASKGAAFGIILIILTQNPKAKIIDTLIRGNMSTRIAFRVASPVHSRTILGQNVNGHGAHQLPRTHRGRMMARLDGALTEMQGYYVSDEMVRKVVAGIQDQNWPRAAQLKIIDPGVYAAEAEAVERGMDDAEMYLGETDDDFKLEDALELSENEWAALRVAMEEMDGALAVNPLFETTRQRGVDISQGTLRSLLSRLESQGWIESPRSVTAPRRCTNALIEQIVTHNTRQAH